MLARAVYDQLPYEVQQLFKHRVAGERNGTSMQKVLQAIRNSTSWASETRRSNVHLAKGTPFEQLRDEAAAEMMKPPPTYNPKL